MPGRGAGIHVLDGSARVDVSSLSILRNIMRSPQDGPVPSVCLLIYSVRARPAAKSLHRYGNKSHGKSPFIVKFACPAQFPLGERGQKFTCDEPKHGVSPRRTTDDSQQEGQVISISNGYQKVITAWYPACPASSGSAQNVLVPGRCQAFFRYLRVIAIGTAPACWSSPFFARPP